jgi:hypothetical protein
MMYMYKGLNESNNQTHTAPKNNGQTKWVLVRSWAKGKIWTRKSEMSPQVIPDDTAQVRHGHPTLRANLWALWSWLDALVYIYYARLPYPSLLYKIQSRVKSHILVVQHPPPSQEYSRSRLKTSLSHLNKFHLFTSWLASFITGRFSIDCWAGDTASSLLRCRCPLLRLIAADLWIAHRLTVSSLLRRRRSLLCFVATLPMVSSVLLCCWPLTCL